ncbi:MAG: hypothetical protein V4717_05600 [Bacteroidota bacterium]
MRALPNRRSDGTIDNFRGRAYPTDVPMERKDSLSGHTVTNYENL